MLWLSSENSAAALSAKAVNNSKLLTFDILDFGAQLTEGAALTQSLGQPDSIGNVASEAMTSEPVN